MSGGQKSTRIHLSQRPITARSEVEQVRNKVFGNLPSAEKPNEEITLDFTGPSQGFKMPQGNPVNSGFCRQYFRMVGGILFH